MKASLFILFMLCVQLYGGEDFTKDIRPVLEKHCYGCHGPEKQKGKLRLDNLDLDFDRGQSAETWHDVLDQVAKDEMPPEDEPRLPEGSRQRLTSWLRMNLDAAAKARLSTGGQGVMRRLTRYEYANTLRDLLGMDLDYARDLPPEPASADGFQNNGQALGVSADQLEYYLAIARDALSKAILEGEKPEVVHAQVSKSTPAQKGKGAVEGSLVLPGRSFLGRFDQFPREGEVRVRVRTTCEIPDGAGIPEMRVSIGVRADVESPQKTLALVEVPAGEHVYEFVARIEKFPLPGHNPKYPGLLVKVTNEYDDGSGFSSRKPQKAKKPKKGETPEPAPADPDEPRQPRIHVRMLEFEGPLFDAWPPSRHVRLVGHPDDGTEDSRARASIRKFMGQAFRRPVKADEAEGMFSIYQQIRKEAGTYESAMRETLALVLAMPDFLYLVEPSPGKRRKLEDYEIASRLSYFLWSTMPDDGLSGLAKDGRLHEPEILRRQVRRMLQDPKSWEFVRHFTGQWLNLPGIKRVAVNPQFYPGFDDSLKEDMAEETLQFFAEILRSNTSAMQLIASDFAIVNRPLAIHYGLPSVPPGKAFQRVSLVGVGNRGGLLSQGGILLANSDGEQSHPIRRAVWLLDRVLGTPPAPPPPDVPILDANDPKIKNLTVREKMEFHREKAACADCHKDIDPWGLAFEEYDAVGRFRETWRPSKGAKPQPVDAIATLPDGKRLEGLAGLKQYLLLHHRDQFATALTRKIMAYALGRSLEFTDEAAVLNLSKQFADSDYQLQTLITSLVLSEPFLTR
jgi:hypothetical protein